LYVNHVLQAEGIKFGLEGHRRAMPFCMGSLYWQINDVWPVASWSSTDYYQNWKALQYYVKKGFEPVLVSPFTFGDN
jgi:beta-mannosidase